MILPPLVLAAVLAAPMVTAGPFEATPRLVSLVDLVRERSPILDGLVATLASIPGAQLRLVLRPPHGLVRAHADLQIVRAARGTPAESWGPGLVQGTVYIPPARPYEEIAGLLAHELSHVLDAANGLDSAGPESESRALEIERQVRIQVLSWRRVPDTSLTTRAGGDGDGEVVWFVM